MELLVATWTLRIAIVAALAVAGVSISAGAPVIDAIDRGMVAAVAFTFAGRWFLRRLESPEKRVQRMRRQRAAGRSKARGSKAAASKDAARTGQPAAAVGATVSRSA